MTSDEEVLSISSLAPPPQHLFAMRSHDEEENNNEPSLTRIVRETEIAEEFSKNGFAILSQALPTNILAEWRSFADEYFQLCFEWLHKLGHIRAPGHQFSAQNNTNNADMTGTKHGQEYTLGLGAKNGFREIVMRSPGRYELSLLHFLDQTNAALESAANIYITIPDTSRILQLLDPILPNLLGKQNNGEDLTAATTSPATEQRRLKLCHLSLIVATPGSVDQGWHADGGHLSVTEHLPCHCFNVFIPLQDIPLDMGPTEFRPGGHYLTRNLAPMMLAAKCRKTLRKPVWPAQAFGDVVLFDYRVLHRGRANYTDCNRNVLVFTFCEPWFEDILNFPKRSMIDKPCDGDLGHDEDKDTRVGS